MERVEAFVSRMIEGWSARLFGAKLQPVQIAKRLIRTMEAHQTISLSKTFVPNSYVVSLSATDFAQFEQYRRTSSCSRKRCCPHLEAHFTRSTSHRSRSNATDVAPATSALGALVDAPATSRGRSESWVGRNPGTRCPRSARLMLDNRAREGHGRGQGGSLAFSGTGAAVSSPVISRTRRARRHSRSRKHAGSAFVWRYTCIIQSPMARTNGGASRVRS